ncbi:MAG: hypothetical protein A3H33_08355 [Betaproteobacteria bacterium RIFCSPLOWO2_02_FULL_65_20]|nr:MAG: hypothetical protein A3H33_08355 [Betaproteobacteria bacterium RIFCSPLOWO2_02_FULL_65_20]
MLSESRRIASLLLSDPDEATWRQAVEIENILQKKAPATARRQARLIRRRLSLSASIRSVHRVARLSMLGLTMSGM